MLAFNLTDRGAGEAFQIQQKMKPPDGNGGGGNQTTYAERLKTNVKYDQRLERNILEIVLEKTDKEADYDLPQENIARVFRTIGIDIQKHVEGSQVQYRGRNSVISVWMFPGVELEQFCREDNIKVSEGVMTGSIRPAGRKDVTVTISGLDFNTPDTFVFQYLNKFGRLVNQNVIYCKYTEGPFAGKFNGDRKYSVDFSDSAGPMGTYHIIDGAKTRVFYRGNIKTCGRCHKFAYNCPGEGVAKVCEENSGERTKLSDWMRELWGKVGFKPDSFELLDEDDKNGTLIIDKEKFPRFEPKVPKLPEIEKYGGVTIKNLPSKLSVDDIEEFFKETGDVEDNIRDKLKIVRGPKTMSVTIEPLDPKIVTKIVDSIDFTHSRTKFFNVPLYCRPLRIQTPVKPKSTDTVSKSPSSKPSPKSGKAPSTHVIGGVIFKMKELNEFVLHEDDDHNIGTQSNKRNSVS